MNSRNALSKSAQFSFAADLFILQAILRSEGNDTKSCQLEYVFPLNCFRQVIDWLLDNISQFGIQPFRGVMIKTDVSEVRVTFPDESEQDKMHRFFANFNEKRKQAQGIDSSFPPMPDVYQGESKPVLDVIERYMVFIAYAFGGDTNTVPIPTSHAGEDFLFRCS
jgi:hypothetical protein